MSKGKKTVRLWQRIPCPDCRRAGFVGWDNVDEQGYSYTKYSECKRCEGGGQVNVSKEEKLASKKG